MDFEKMNTRSGLTPDLSKTYFNITTSDVEKYLQKKLDTKLNNLKELVTDRDIKLKIITYDLSNIFTRTEFAPLCVILPMNKDTNINTSRPSLIPGYDLYHPVTFLNNYTFDDHDDMFDSRYAYWRRMNISVSSMHIFTKYVNPRIMKIGDEEKIVFFIDPTVIFYEMLMSEKNDFNFCMEIQKHVKIEQGDYRYSILCDRGRKPLRDHIYYLRRKLFDDNIDNDSVNTDMENR